MASALLILHFLPGILGLRDAGAMPLYGTDDRVETSQAATPSLTQAAQSVAALVRAELMFGNGEDATYLQAEKLGDVYGLCKDQRFYDQPTVAFCSAALIGKDLLLTAAHCVETASDCSDIRAVFGYSYYGKGALPLLRPNKDVYTCSKVLLYKFDGDIDIALLKLDRSVEGRKPLQLSSNSSVDQNTAGLKVYMIGSPLGTPLKITGPSTVYQDSSTSFRSDSDVFAGNSGSPIFNAKTMEIEGVATAAFDKDLSPRGNCMVYKQTNQLARGGSDDGGGMEATKVFFAADALASTPKLRRIGPPQPDRSSAALRPSF